MKKLSTAQFIYWMAYTSFKQLKWISKELRYLIYSVQVLVLIIVSSALMIPVILLWVSSTFNGLKGIMGFLYMAFALILLVFSIKVTLRWDNGRLWWKPDVLSNVSTRETWLGQRDAERDSIPDDDDDDNDEDEDEGVWVVETTRL